MRSILVAVALFVQLPRAECAPAPSAPPFSEELREALRNLDHPRYRVRSLAAKKLLEAGLIAIAPLAEVARRGSIESADRAMKILQELAFNGGEEARAGAHAVLHQLAESKTQAREPAREILKLYRAQVMDRMQLAGAAFQFDDDKVRAVYLNQVQDLKSVLPLLREFPEIEEVSVENKKFGDQEMKHLLPLRNLRWLNLFESNIGDEGLKHLKNFPKLESIPMGHTRVTDEGLKQLAELTQLQYVGLRGDDVTDAGLVHLKKLTNLTGLTLGETKVTGAGFVHLKAMANLHDLRLYSAPITDDGLVHLHGLQSLRRIELQKTKVTANGMRRLRELIPELMIVSEPDVDEP